MQLEIPCTLGDLPDIWCRCTSWNPYVVTICRYCHRRVWPGGVIYASTWIPLSETGKSLEPTALKEGHEIVPVYMGYEVGFYYYVNGVRR